jgi:hypothetical protein
MSSFFFDLALVAAAEPVNLSDVAAAAQLCHSCIH